MGTKGVPCQLQLCRWLGSGQAARLLHRRCSGWSVLQDLALILEQIPSYWSKEGEKSSHPASAGRPDIQTFVFSATLTLPASLRKRLHKGACLECRPPQQDVDSWLPES